MKLLFAYTCLFILCVVTCCINANAQLPTCNTPGLVYFNVGSSIYNYDPYLPVSASNPSLNTITTPGTGLAVSTNINSAGPSPTFYTVSGNNYWYYDGTTWVNTGHSVGNPAAVNIAGGGGYLYALVGGTGEVYKYDGTGNGTLVTTVTGFSGGGPFDLVADVFGNWYILKLTTGNGGPYLRKYSPTGSLIQTWGIFGSPGTGSGGGFAIICDSIYIQSANDFYKGYVGSTIISLTQTTNPVTAGTAGDMASCPAGTGAGTASIDTGYYCGSGPGVPVTVSGNGTVTWTVLSGNSIVNGTGTSVDITATTTSRILVSIAGGQGICSNGVDTVTIVVPTATITFPSNIDTLAGCGIFKDTLQAFVIGTPGLTYNYNWTPSASISSGGNTLSPVITPTSNTNYVINVSVPASQGGCTWRDSVVVILKDESVVPDFTYSIKYGCVRDTVVFQNATTNGKSYTWYFGDGTKDTLLNPVHIYPNQNAYTVKLVAGNTTCKDSVVKQVDTQHPLAASFTTNKDTICEGQSVIFTNTSIFSAVLGPARYLWLYGDGTPGDNSLNPTHLFAKPGVYSVGLVIADQICNDTAFRTIVVDSIVLVDFETSDSSVCEGQAVRLTAFTPSGTRKIQWDFGDGLKIDDQSQVTHAYDTSGIFTVSVTANSRSCPDINTSKKIEIKPYPVVGLGKDTSICTNGNPVILLDYENWGRPLTTWKWNTGATTASISVKKPGTYSVTVTKKGCATSDTVEVYKDCYIDIPNAFSPNGDGINETFIPRPLLGRGFTEFKMTVYNRWGQEIFVTTNFEGRGWDGKFNGVDQPVGVYIYMIDLVLKNAASEHYEGNVTLIR